MIIRPATIDDIPSMMALDRASAGAGHWSETQYEQLFAPETPEREILALVAQTDDMQKSAIQVFLVARQVAPEWELENIVVASSARRNGLATRLLSELIKRARQTNSTSVFLEVRESNQAARGLYEKLGFRETGRRKAYYQNPLEDALLYSLNLRRAQFS